VWPGKAGCVSDFMSNILCVNSYIALAALSVQDYVYARLANSFMHWAQKFYKSDLTNSHTDTGLVRKFKEPQQF
jgi:hypothetical protein